MIQHHDDGGRLTLSASGRPLLTCNYGPEVVRPYLYPVRAADGTLVTRSWPMVDAPGDTTDHRHHRGIFTGHGEVNGVDNWSESKAHGRQIHRGFVDLKTGHDCGGYVEALDWTDPARAVVMTELRTVMLHAPDDRLVTIDYAVALRARARDFGDTKEAGLVSIRVATSMDADKGGRIRNSEGGSGETACWGKPARWCDYDGPIYGRRYGICLMDHPDNPRHPTCWHVRDYGLFTANCFGLHDFNGTTELSPLEIPAGESRTWRYRIVIHVGELAAREIEARYEDFARGATA